MMVKRVAGVDGSYKPRKIKVFLQQPKLTEARKASFLQDSEDGDPADSLTSDF